MQRSADSPQGCDRIWCSVKARLISCGMEERFSLRLFLGSGRVALFSHNSTLVKISGQINRSAGLILPVQVEVPPVAESCSACPDNVLLRGRLAYNRRGGGNLMTIFNDARGRVIDANSSSAFRLFGIALAAFLVEPNLRAAIRESTASHSANALYTGEREAVAKQIYTQLSDKLGERGILVESVLLRDIQLPATLKSSIESKQQAEQEALAMNFRLQKETQEAQRKRIEAAGIRDFQQIVAQGISPQLLEWKGIEATESLAKSTNSKVVVIGNSKNGLPLILGQ